MVVLKGEERNSDVWADLTQTITDEMLAHIFVLPEYRANLKADIDKIIKQFVKERIVACYFTCTQKKAKFTPDIDAEKREGGE
jgi:hypothetical protein